MILKLCLNKYDIQRLCESYVLCYVTKSLFNDTLHNLQFLKKSFIFCYYDTIPIDVFL